KNDVWTVKQAFKTSSFWFICLSFGAILFTTNIILAHQVAFMVDVGYKTSFAAFIFGVFGITSLPFRVVWGFFTDRIGPVTTYTISTILLLGGIIALLAIKSPSQAWLPYVFALLWGCSYGTTIVIVAVVSANLFQGKNFGVIFGFITLFGQLIGSPGAWVGGYLFDLNGNYHLAFILASVSAAVSCALMWALNIIKRNETGLPARA
ncbi:MAG: MFS transporter, partial [Dehalococcoidia bacterium]|nr:MFS transporter [Dehalococcoidia bacterium]